MIYILPDKAELARAAAASAGQSIRSLLSRMTTVRMLAATGTSQLNFLAALGAEEGIEWDRVELFHLDEYVGIGIDHPASFARYIKERIVEPLGIRKFHLLDGLREPGQMAREMSAQISSAPVQLAVCGIGENGHLAFNDPPADFDAI